ncbi:MAG: hypothetical protein LBM78_04295 [Clostridiales bacterium]|jgi:hypothetical protein|nr:hypothetical protein [Clostridiales bacterium]
MFDIQTTQKFKLLLCTADAEREERLVELLGDCQCRPITILPARGGAGSDVLGLLGLEDNRRILVTSFVREEDAAAVAATLREKLYNRMGVGLAVVVDILGYLGAKTAYQYFDTATTSEDN